jgi:hypothetical protein
METLLQDFLRWADPVAIAVFAASGALVASRKGLDVVGFILIAAVTGFGGGTVRDLLLGRTPVFWLRAPLLLGICAVVAVAVFFAAHRLESRMVGRSDPQHLGGDGVDAMQFVPHHFTQLRVLILFQQQVHERLDGH